MHAPVIRIGNSKGIRLPAALLKACNISDEVDIELNDGRLIITPVKTARQGWDAAFSEMHASEEDTPYIDDILEDEDEDWVW